MAVPRDTRWRFSDILVLGRGAAKWQDIVDELEYGLDEGQVLPHIPAAHLRRDLLGLFRGRQRALQRGQQQLDGPVVV